MSRVSEMRPDTPLEQLTLVSSTEKASDASL